MKKNVLQVFLIVGALVLALIVWALFFGGKGVLVTGWNTVVEPMNEVWKDISGSTRDIIPEFNNSDAKTGDQDGLGDVNW